MPLAAGAGRARELIRTLKLYRETIQLMKQLQESNDLP